jgi:anti-sigma28 factor (negative regulator of flagellin synthesis)
MNPINNVGSSNPVYKATTAAIAKQAPAQASGKSSATDRVELSGVGHLLKALKNNDIRADKVASIKAQIEAGTYDDDKKLDVAVGRLLEDLDK